MARSKKQQANGHHDEQQTAEESRQATFDFTPGKVVAKLVTTCASFAKQISVITGDMREALANAVEKKKLHKRAFARVRAELNMDPAQRLEYFAHYDHYAQVTGVRNINVEASEGDEESEPAGRFSSPKARAPAEVG